MAANEWTNYGDANIADEGGTMIRSDTSESNTFDFFQVKVGNVDGETVRFAMSGTVVGIDFNDYEDALAGAASEFGFASVEEFAAAEPERAVVELLENYGYGAMEFSATNKDGQGAYSTDLNDFKLTDGELADFMRAKDIPEQYIPEMEYEVTARYGETGIESSMKTNEWSLVEAFSHDKLMDGLNVEIKDVMDGSSCVLDAGEYQDKFDGEFPVNPSYELEADWGDSSGKDIDDE